MLASVMDLVDQRPTDDDSPAIAAFARAYVRRFSQTSGAQLSAAACYAQVLNLFDFIKSRPERSQAVRVFTPTAEPHGYATGGSVVELVVDDAPFLVDSITAEIQSRGFAALRVLHPVIGVTRDETDYLTEVTHARRAHHRESVQHYELDRVLDDEEAADLQAAVDRILTDTHAAVRDFERMTRTIDRMVAIAEAGRSRYPPEDVYETTDFLRWLLDGNFVFLGYREYRITGTGSDREISVAPGSGLGILQDHDKSGFAEPVKMSSLSNALRTRYEEGGLLVITKTNRLSRIHRRVRMDYIGVRNIGPDGEVIGEARLVGLFTSKTYMTRATQIPLLRRKLDQILEAEDLIEGSHDHKLAIQLFESFPKDELFATPTEEIRRSIAGLLTLEEDQHVKLFVRRDLLNRNVSLLVSLPRDRFNADLRKALQSLFKERFNGTSVDYRLALGDTGSARIHFTVWVAGEIPTVPFKDLEQDVIALTRNWQDRVTEFLIERLGEQQGRRLAEKWVDRLPNYYTTSVPIEQTPGDILCLDQLSEERPVVAGLQNESQHGPGDPLTRVAVYRLDGKRPLSDLMPILEDLGLYVIEELPVRLRGGNGNTFIHDFGVLGADRRPLDLERGVDRIADTIESVVHGLAESDSLNRLIVLSDLTHRQVGILRAYRTYWQRVGSGFTVEYMNEALADHPDIATKLVQFFEARFDPTRDVGSDDLRSEIIADLDAVRSLDQDRILRGFLGLIESTVRTSAYRPDRQSLSFKLRSASVPGMPKPYPLYEIFVYAPEVEGVHLRGGMVARGGLRWSTRREDYRTEVLGLMKAQMTKNAVIVPTGSKGGFVLRGTVDPGELRTAVKNAYLIFIKGLLDVTDNRVGGKVVHPPDVRVHDGDDPYLVVAADKGTATFSDAANEVADEYGFWLGDAFASGGSAGYDHKELGITARGAWESVKWHFRAMGRDTATEPFSVIGIGDMSGDVFGNGMLLSDQIRLLAAFDHRHVFIDPDPEPAVGYRERRRLYELPGSSWESYDQTLLSPGGGIYPRSVKRIDLSPQARKVLGTDVESGTPDEVIKIILQAPVDLLWNGGIGTYVKATGESHEAAGDRTNDTVRINGRDLRCKAVAEGGNLGLTQPGRIEFALSGGRINTDFIDNSGGVHCSDREVNLKILLGIAEEGGELDRTARDQLVEEVAADVVDAILYDNFLQAQILSQEVEASAGRLEAYEDLMQSLETEELLDRAIEQLPTSDDITERVRSGLGLTSPELAVLLAYAKRSLTDVLLESDLPDWPSFEQDLPAYFPEPVVERFGELIAAHPLRRELIATIVANEVINAQGITFVSRLTAETGTEAADVVRCYRIAREVTGAEERWDAIESLVGSIEPALQSELMGGVDWLVEAISRWYLAHPTAEPMIGAIESARAAFQEISEALPEIGPVQWRTERKLVVDQLSGRGVPFEVAHRHAYQSELVHAPDIIELGHITGRPIRYVARVFFLLGQIFGVNWLEARLDQLPAASRWHRQAIQTVEEDLLALRRELAEHILLEAPAEANPQQAMETYLAVRSKAHDRLTRFMRTLAIDGVDDVASVIVAIRQIRALVG
jgi:glutamate dehydrogenase